MTNRHKVIGGDFHEAISEATGNASLSATHAADGVLNPVWKRTVPNPFHDSRVDEPLHGVGMADWGQDGPSVCRYHCWLLPADVHRHLDSRGRRSTGGQAHRVCEIKLREK